MDAEPLVRDYLERLETAAWPLPADRRGELLAEVREHIQSALTEAGTPDEITTRNVLERLGDPAEIVAAEMGSVQSTAPVGALAETARGPRWGPGEVAAIVFLTAGSIFLPIIGPLVGLAFVWTSAEWTIRQKRIATLIVVALLVMPVIGLLSVSARAGTGL